MKQKKRTRVLALHFAALFLFTSLPLSGLSAFAYQHGEVVESNSVDIEGSVNSAPKEDGQDPADSLPNGTVEEDTPAAEEPPSPAASPEPIDNSVTEGNEDEWVCLPLEYTMENGASGARKAKICTRGARPAAL